MKALKIYISGRVQGVFFRAGTKRKADQLGISGWVKNLADGRVEAVFQGSQGQLEKMLAWCKKGPPDAEVEAVETKQAAVKKRKGFQIKR